MILLICHSIKNHDLHFFVPLKHQKKTEAFNKPYVYINLSAQNPAD